MAKRINFPKILLIPMIGVIMMLTSISLMVLFEYRSWEEIQNLPRYLIIFILVHSTVVVVLMDMLVKRLNEVLPWNRHWIKRITADALIILGMTVAMIYLRILFELLIVKSDIFYHENSEMIFVMPLMSHTLFMAMVETIRAADQRRDLEIKLERLEKEKMKAQFSALRNQLDHHFLFNNLSVLSSLIYEDTEKADQFIQDFAKVYRYVLQINQKDLVTLEEELEFIDAYLKLYKGRFEKAFDFNIIIPKTYHHYSLPPLSLQVLVENAVKHNSFSQKSPLFISIDIYEEKLRVINNKQEVKHPVVSTATGHDNLRSKYQLLQEDGPEFMSNSDEYTALLPLLKPQVK